MKATAQSKGCKVCKSNLAVVREQERAKAMKEESSKKNRMRRCKWTNTSPYKNCKAIRQHLLSETNPHNTFVLRLMDRKKLPKPPEGLEVDDCHISTQIHHILLFLATTGAMSVFLMKLG
jgi:hypothetical protein